MHALTLSIVSSIYIIFYIILSVFIRLSRDYLLLAALWCSKKKAPPVSVLQPFIEEMALLEDKGIIQDHLSKHAVYTL